MRISCIIIGGYISTTRGGAVHRGEPPSNSARTAARNTAQRLQQTVARPGWRRRGRSNQGESKEELAERARRLVVVWWWWESATG